MAASFISVRGTSLSLASDGGAVLSRAGWTPPSPASAGIPALILVIPPSHGQIDEVEQSAHCLGDCRNVGQRSRREDRLGALVLLDVHQPVALEKCQRPAAGVELHRQCHQGEDHAQGEHADTHPNQTAQAVSLIHISEPTRLGMISYAVFCLKKKKDK